MRRSQGIKRKASKLFLVSGLLFALGISGFYLYLRPKYVVPILMYHHINDRGEVSSLSVSPENFKRQMFFLVKRNYQVISLAEFVQRKLTRQAFARNTVVLTFDDGYVDNYFFAYPVLKRYNLPATIFVIVKAIGQPGYLDYTQIKQMLSSGIIDIGSHSLSGEYLPGKSALHLEQEIARSQQILEEKLNKKIDFFAYPLGGFNAQIQEMLKRYGFKAACTTNRGNVQTYLNNDLFALKRIKVKDSPFNLFVFWAKLSGYYNLFRRVRKPD